MALISERDTVGREWRGALVSHRLSAIFGWIGWVIGCVAALLAVDVLPEPGMLWSRRGRAQSQNQVQSRFSGPASLVLAKTTGWPGDWQKDARSSFPATWRGAGAWVSGELQVDRKGILWSPKPAWRSFGAKEFLISWPEVGWVRVLEARRTHAAVIDLRAPGQVWFAIHAPGLGPAIETLAQKG